MSEDNANKPNSQPPAAFSRPSRTSRRHSESPKSRRLRRGTGKKQRRSPYNERFKGATEALEGNVFDCGYSQTEQYNKTVKAIAEYVGIMYKNGTDVRISIEQIERVNIPISEEPGNATSLQTRIWQKEVDEAVRRRTILKQNLKTLFSLMWGQCTAAMRAKVESLGGYDDIKAKADGIGLLQGIRNICFGAVEQNRYKPQAMHEALRKFYHFKQDKYMSESDYLEKFKTLTEVCDSLGCNLGSFQAQADAFLRENDEDPDTVDELTMTAALDIAKEEYFAIAFILSANRDKYGKMIQDLMNQFLQGDADAFPNSLTDAHRLLVNWRTGGRQNGNIHAGKGIAYAQQGERQNQGGQKYGGNGGRGRGPYNRNR